jgi:hypothetical protein
VEGLLGGGLWQGGQEREEEEGNHWCAHRRILTGERGENSRG